MDITRLCIYHKFYVFILIFIINYIFPTIEKIRTSCKGASINHLDMKGGSAKCLRLSTWGRGELVECLRRQLISHFTPVLIPRFEIQINMLVKFMKKITSVYWELG